MSSTRMHRVIIRVSKDIGIDDKPTYSVEMQHEYYDGTAMLDGGPDNYSGFWEINEEDLKMLRRCIDTILDTNNSVESRTVEESEMHVIKSDSKVRSCNGQADED